MSKNSLSVKNADPLYVKRKIDDAKSLVRKNKIAASNDSKVYEALERLEYNIVLTETNFAMGGVASFPQTKHSVSHVDVPRPMKIHVILVVLILGVALGWIAGTILVSLFFLAFCIAFWLVGYGKEERKTDGMSDADRTLYELHESVKTLLDCVSLGKLEQPAFKCASEFESCNRGGRGWSVTCSISYVVCVLSAIGPLFRTKK